MRCPSVCVCVDQYHDQMIHSIHARKKKSVFLWERLVGLNVHNMQLDA